MSKVVDESQSDWDEKIGTVLKGYSASSKQSPSSCYKNMHQPIDNDLLPSNEEEIDSEENLKLKLLRDCFISEGKLIKLHHEA